VDLRAQAQCIMDEAHKTSLFSKALRGDTAVKLMVDERKHFRRQVDGGSKREIANYTLL
jgi:hypothetical protein